MYQERNDEIVFLKLTSSFDRWRPVVPLCGGWYTCIGLSCLRLSCAFVLHNVTQRPLNKLGRVLMWPRCFHSACSNSNSASQLGFLIITPTFEQKPSSSLAAFLLTWDLSALSVKPGFWDCTFLVWVAKFWSLELTASHLDFNNLT